MPIITLNIPNGQPASRVSVAYGKKLRLGRDATAADIRDHFLDQIRATVKEMETETARAAAVAAAEAAAPVDVT